MTDPHSDPLSSRDATAMAAALARGETDSVSLVQTHLDRIARLDPGLGAFVRLDPGAAARAAESDARRRAGAPGPLDGIPVAIKDNLATAGLETSCASRILAGFVPMRDATVVARLRRAGAIVLGKTNLDEFGMGSSNESSAHGPVRNPFDRSRVAGGSSGGSAAAVAARLVPVSLGSDTGGSVRLPAAFCGVLGLKPTYGRLSRSGLIAYASSLDQVGLFARSADDLEQVLALLDGADPLDATSCDPPAAPGPPGDPPLAGVAVGVLRGDDAGGVDREISAAVGRAAEALAQAGANLVERSLPSLRYAVAIYYVLATAEASSNLARYDGVRFGARRGDDDGGFDSVVAASRALGFGEEVRRRILLGTYVLSAGYREATYERARRARTLVARELVEALGGPDGLLLLPVSPTPAFRLGERIDDPLAMYLADLFTVPMSLAGLPALAAPAGLSATGLPLGVQLVAARWREDLLLRAARELARHWPCPLPPPPIGATA